MPNSNVKFAAAEINTTDPKEVRYWCRRLRCRQSDLIAAVIVLGPAVEGVEEYVRRCAAIARRVPNDSI